MYCAMNRSNKLVNGLHIISLHSYVRRIYENLKFIVPIKIENELI